MGGISEVFNRVASVLSSVFSVNSVSEDRRIMANAGEAGVDCRRRFAGLAPDVLKVARHLTRIDRVDEAASVRALYSEMQQNDTRSGALFLYGDDDDGPDDFSDRLSHLAHETSGKDDLFDHWSSGEIDDWPRSEDIFSTLSYCDPFPVRGRGGRLHALLENHCDDGGLTTQQVLDNIAKSNSLCIFAFSVPKTDARKICIAKHFRGMISLAEGTHQDGEASPARFLFIYRFEAEKPPGKLEDLHALKALFSGELPVPHRRIDTWSEVSLDHLDEWREIMRNRVIQVLGEAGDRSLAEAMRLLWETYDGKGGIKLGQAIETLKLQMRALHDGSEHA